VELVEISNMARGGAKAAQETADLAVEGVHRANSRITALDDYDVKNDIVVNFKVGSAKLSSEAQTNLDDIANAAKDQTGYVIEVAGFASADGNLESNRRLSQRRADVVIRYLVEQHAIPVRRILNPYGYGELNPVADNSNRQGRNQNRRVEVRLLVNRGLSMPVDATSHTLNQTDTTSQTQVN
jgi:outer membrane protein OmpA-like peptidoglycan-associated protein